MRRTPHPPLIEIALRHLGGIRLDLVDLEENESLTLYGRQSLDAAFRKVCIAFDYVRASSSREDA